MQSVFSQVFFITLLAAGVRMAMPILLAAAGEIFAERSGILNINLEGQMLMGAFFSFVAGFYTKNIFLALSAGILGGMLQALFMTLVCVTLGVQHVVAGITLNMFALGCTSFWYRVVFGVTTAPPRADVGTGRLAIPLLRKIPWLGEIFFNQNILFYAALVITALSSFVLFKTQFGLKIRAAGEYPRAAETMGVKVNSVKYLSMAICGALAGMGGSYLSLISLNYFMDNITASRGFIALAIVIFGKWNPWMVFFASLLFGTTDALQLRLQAVGVNAPYQFMLMLPYLLTILVMVITSRRSHFPAALGLNYEREKL
ncbi:MAG: ABC transporter permease [Treponema sp.]|jgi:simple sugar transport system permease protein|nr:ABC transporter permease [Treponema sp.]